MASGTLYTYSGSFRADKILIAAAYSGANVSVDPNFEFGKTNTSAEFLKKFPLGKVPAFESNGVYLNESDAIAQFVSNEALLGGNNPANQASVREYISFSENEIVPSACTWVFPTLGFKQYNKQDTEKAMDHIKKCLAKLNNDLLTRTFLVGERVTLADITLCTSLVMLYAQVLDPKFREAYGNVNRWFMTCVNQPNFKKVLGEIKMCEKMATFDNKRYQELHPKGGKDKGKKEKTKEEKKPKEKAAPAPAPAPTQEAPKPKKIDYFADVPKSDMILDDWKKCYQNNDNIEDSIKWLDENFDKNAYSLWYLDYDTTPEDAHKVAFLAANLANGFTQRIDGLRKHAHGMLCVFQEEENGTKYFTIRGAWLTRGQKLPFSLNPDWNNDAQHFHSRKLEYDNPADKNLFFKLMNGESADGKEAEDYKLFI